MVFEIIKQLQNDIVENESVLESLPGSMLERGGFPPILQLNTMPQGIDISLYTNPKGPTNPNGDYISLYRFTDLTNNVSQFTQNYFPNGNKIDGIYESIINGASIKPDATFTMNAFLKSKNDLGNYRLSNLGGIPDDWYPTYANPADWHKQVANKGNLFTSEIDFSNPAQSFNSQFTILDNQNNQALSWNRLTSTGKITEIDLKKESSLQKIKFKYMQVQINRSWLNYDIFKMGGWYLGGQDVGFVSSGDVNDNDGILPLYPTSFIIATDLEIEGSLGSVDSKLVSDSIAKDGSINLGPFNINAISNDTKTNTDVLVNEGYFILAWISQLVNLSPQISQSITLL